MSDGKYVELTQTLEAKLGHLIEECGEVVAAAGKSVRWGLDSFNPELPPAQRETNAAWLLRELHDLDLAMQRLRTELAINGYREPTP